jgi:hypothetical protein
LAKVEESRRSLRHRRIIHHDQRFKLLPEIHGRRGSLQAAVSAP